MNFPVFDLHCDTSLKLLAEKPAKGLRSNDLHIDLERARVLPGYAQCFASFTTTCEEMYPGSPSAEEVFKGELAAITWEIEENKDLIQFARSAEEIRKNFQNGIMSAVLTIEGPAGFGFDPARLAELYEIGFRITTLSWNEDNPLTGSCVTKGGLKEQGKVYLKEAQRLGMIVDVSHLSDAGFWDIMELTEKPIIASHSNSRTICNVSRNITDEMYLAICQSGGTVGITQCRGFIGGNYDVDSFCDHIFHFLQLAGSDKHISLGGDMDGCPILAEEVLGIEDYQKIAVRLLERGLSEKTVHRIFWDNALEVMEKCAM